jgi:hypothetical protein
MNLLKNNQIKKAKMSKKLNLLPILILLTILNRYFL